MTICIAPLGRDYNATKTEVGDATALRCEVALREAERLRKREDVVLAMAPGSEAARPSGPTMATMMENFFSGRGVSFPLCVNHVEREVFGTLREMRWVIRASPHAKEYVFVAAPRHSRRVRYIAKMFFPKRSVRVVTTTEPPVPLWNEALAYAKLLAVRLGFEHAAESFRRRFTLPIAK